MLRNLLLILFILLLAGCSSGTGNILREDPPLTNAEWTEDLNVLARELPRRHANAFHTASRSEFDNKVAALHASLPELSQDSIYVGFRQIVTMIGDGHTNIAIPANWPVLPLRFRWFGDPVNDPGGLELHVTHATKEYEEMLGARVTGIGGNNISAVYEKLTTIIGSGETEGSSRMASSVLMIWPDLLRGLGIVQETDSVRITFTENSGQEFERRVKPYTPGTPNEWHNAAAQAPLYLTRRGDQFWYTRLPDANGDSTTVYLAFNGYPGYFSFWRQSRALMKYIDRHNAHMFDNVI